MGTGTTTETTFAIQSALLEQAEVLAQRLNISQSQLFESALEQFIRIHQSPALPDDGQAIINQGDIYWLRSDGELKTDIPHPHVVIQDNVFNHSRIHTVVMCALTSNLKRVNMPGNVMLDAGEANLTRQSVVEVTKVSSVDKTQLGEYIGTLSEARIHQILAGMRFVQASFFGR